jgi:O-antigen/teichoic acid export membrane protein
VCFVASVPHLLRAVRREHGRVSLHPTASGVTSRDFWSYAAPRGLEEIFQATNVWLLVLLVGAMASPSEAATYATVSRFTLASTLLMQAITNGMAARFTTSFVRGETHRTQTLFRTATQWTVGLSIPVCVTMCVFPEAMIHLVSPDLPGGSTGLRIMAIACLLNVITGPGGAAILFAGRSRWNLWIAISAFAMMIVVALVAIPHAGANGACLAWALAMTVQSVLCYVVARRAFQLTPFSRASTLLGGWSAALSLVAQIAVRWVGGEGLTALLVGVALTAALLVAGNAWNSWAFWRAQTVPA